jgi:hypothetical protein
MATEEGKKDGTGKANASRGKQTPSVHIRNDINRVRDGSPHMAEDWEVESFVPPRQISTPGPVLTTTGDIMTDEGTSGGWSGMKSAPVDEGGCPRWEHATFEGMRGSVDIMDGMESLGRDVPSDGDEDLTCPARSSTAVASKAGSRARAWEILMECTVTVGGESGGNGRVATEGRLLMKSFPVAIGPEIGMASVSSALSGFGSAFRRVRGLTVEEEGSLDELAVAAASNDIATVGCLLGPRDVNAIRFNGKSLPESLVFRPLKCSLLESAVGSGSVEMTKYLLEFHSAKPTRGTLKMAISTGSAELIKLMRERLAEAELGARLDLLEVAADFHQVEVVAWLLRDATILERELLVLFGLEYKLADTLEVACESGCRPWWHGSREVARKWRARAGVELVPAPEGFSGEGGWLMAKGGEETALPPVDSGGDWVWTLRDSFKGKALVCAALPAGVTTIGRSAVEACSELMHVKIPSSVTKIEEFALGGCSGLTRLEFPSSLTTIGPLACYNCSSLTRLEIPSSVATIGGHAFYNCSGLRQRKIQSGVTAIGDYAFSGCSGLTLLQIPSSVTTIRDATFSGCSGLLQLEIPANVTAIERDAFWGCSGLRQHKIQSGVTTIGSSAFSGCSGLAQLEIPPSVTVIRACAFYNCSGLTQLEIPSSVTTIERGAFAGCSRLARLSFPSGLDGLGGKGVFEGVTKLECLTLVGPVLLPAVVSALEGCLTSTAKVIGPALVERGFCGLRFGIGRLGRFTPGGGKFGRFTIVAA